MVFFILYKGGFIIPVPPMKKVVVDKLLSVPECGSVGSRFEPGLPPMLSDPCAIEELFF